MLGCVVGRCGGGFTTGCVVSGSVVVASVVPSSVLEWPVLSSWLSVVNGVFLTHI